MRFANRNPAKAMKSETPMATSESASGYPRAAAARARSTRAEFTRSAEKCSASASSASLAVARHALQLPTSARRPPAMAATRTPAAVQLGLTFVSPRRAGATPS